MMLRSGCAIICCLLTIGSADCCGAVDENALVVLLRSTTLLALAYGLCYALVNAIRTARKLAAPKIGFSGF